MYYAIYRNIRNASWNCLLDFDIHALPVDVLSIARRSNVRVIKNSDVNVLSDNENGKAYYDGELWIIVYDDKKPTETARYTVAHELGHIFLGHKLIPTQYEGTSVFNAKPKAELQADMFALRLLCPACVLWALEVHSAKDMAAACRVSLDTANERAKRMNTLYKREMFLTDPLEKKLLDSFSYYVEEQKNERRAQCLPKE